MEPIDRPRLTAGTIVAWKYASQEKLSSIILLEDEVVGKRTPCLHNRPPNGRPFVSTEDVSAQAVIGRMVEVFD